MDNSPGVSTTVSPSLAVVAAPAKSDTMNTAITTPLTDRNVATGARRMRLLGQQRNRDVVERCEFGQQLSKLEHEPELGQSQT